MAQEISPFCDFIFGSIRTSLSMDTVDVELNVQMVKGSICIERTIPWSP